MYIKTRMKPTRMGILKMVAMKMALWIIVVAVTGARKIRVTQTQTQTWTVVRSQNMRVVYMCMGMRVRMHGMRERWS